jgi:hypothetical protein
MAHFAKLNENNIVLAVHVVNNDVITVDGVESEQAGIDFLTDLHGHTYWKQTSYNGSFRKNFAGIGFYYDASKDAFIPPKPRRLDMPEFSTPQYFDSWTLNETTCRWEPPTPMPTDGKSYTWDEDTTSWVEVA